MKKIGNSPTRNFHTENLIENFDCLSGFVEKFLLELTWKVAAMEDEEKYCTLLMNKISITNNLNYSKEFGSQIMRLLI